MFKGKRKDNGEWIEGSLLVLDADSGYYFITEPFESASTLPVRDLIYNHTHLVDPETVCQFTGLTDKNGNKIWENDVCQYGDSDGYEAEFVVKYGRREDYQGINLGFYIEWLDTDDGYRSDICFWTEDRDVEVIGNIFDNPKLLKGGAV